MPGSFRGCRDALQPHGSGQFWPHLTLEGNGKKLQWAPSADIGETDKEYVIRAPFCSANCQMHLTVETIQYPTNVDRRGIRN